MKRSKLILILGIISLTLTSFELDKSNEKKINKEIKKLWDLENVTYSHVDASFIPDGESIYNIYQSNTLIGSVYFGLAKSRSENIDYAIIFNLDAEIETVKVLKYRENYGSEITSKSWLKQFRGKSKGEQMKIRDDISVISGATISANSITESIERVSKIVYENKNYIFE